MSLLIIAAVTALTVELAAVAKPSEVIGKPGTFSMLRVCGSTSFSRLENRCTRDERRRPISSNRITCSTTLTASRPGVWRVRFGLDHHLDPWSRGGKVSVGATHIWHNFNVGTNMPVPGGNWRCDFAYGSVVASVVFRSSGPREQIVDTAVCSDADVLSFGSKPSGKRCAQDDSGTPFVTPEHIYCSAVFAHPGSKQAKIEVLGPDGTVLSTTNVNIGAPTVSQAAAIVAGSTLSAPGTYSCRFSLANGMTVTRQFQIAAST
jgi:hypothetical protein